MELIDRKQAKTKIYKSGLTNREKMACFATINFCDVIDAEQVRHGRWVKQKEDAMIHWDCSECGIAFLDDAGLDRYFYCPHCGAKMDKEET